MRMRIAVSLLASAALLAACGSGEPGSRRSAAAQQRSSLSSSRQAGSSAATLVLGETARTDSGLRVTVLAWKVANGSHAAAGPGEVLSRVRARVCAGAHPSIDRRIDRSSFSLQMPRHVVVQPVPAPARQGRLGRRIVLRPGECSKVSIPFEVPRGEEPMYVVFNGASLMKWALDFAFVERPCENTRFFRRSCSV